MPPDFIESLQIANSVLRTEVDNLNEQLFRAAHHAASLQEEVDFLRAEVDRLKSQGQ